AGDAAHRAAVGHCGAEDFLAVPLLLGTHLAGGIDLGPRDMAVHIDAAGHDHQTRGIERARGADGRIARRLDNLAAADPQVLDLAVDTIGRVIDVAAGDEEVVGHYRADLTASLAMRSTSGFRV